MGVVTGAGARARNRSEEPGGEQRQGGASEASAAHAEQWAQKRGEQAIWHAPEIGHTRVALDLTARTSIIRLATVHRQLDAIARPLLTLPRWNIVASRPAYLAKLA